jgi:hypothetical protein
MYQYINKVISLQKDRDIVFVNDLLLDLQAFL